MGLGVEAGGMGQEAIRLTSTGPYHRVSNRVSSEHPSRNDTYISTECGEGDYDRNIEVGYLWSEIPDREKCSKCKRG